MSLYETLKKEILSGISPKEVTGTWYEIQDSYIDEAVINRALREHKNVYVPDIGVPIVLHNPIIMPSDTHLKASEYQIFMQARDSAACLLRNEHIQNGKDKPTDPTKRDVNISVEGGIWNIRTKQRCKVANGDEEYVGSLGSVIFSGVENFSLRNMMIFDSYLCGPKGTDDSSYAIQLSNCKDFVVENIEINDNRRDGVHIDGPAEFGLVRHIRGDKAGDDLVSVLSWDWYNSALTFGRISHLHIEDICGSQDEFRLLPGTKVYPDGTTLECDIENCIFENIHNLYTIKMYEQHNIENPFLDFDDSSLTVGNIRNICFKNISFVSNPAGFAGAPVNGFFDVCCNFTDSYFEDIQIGESLAASEEKGISLIKVGPLTYHFGQFGEVFNPDSVAWVDGIHLKNITFSNEMVTDQHKLVKTVNKRKGDFAYLSIGTGSGYGDVGEVFVEE